MRALTTVAGHVISARNAYVEDKPLNVDGLDTGETWWLDNSKTVKIYEATITWSNSNQTATVNEKFYNNAGTLKAETQTVHQYDADDEWLNATQTILSGVGA